MTPIFTTHLRLRRVVPLAAMLSIIASCGARSHVPWPPAEILRDVEPELRRADGLNRALSDATILMWQVEHDRSRNLVVEEALLWARVMKTESQQGNWVLVHAFRHPSDTNVWQRSVSFLERTPDSPWPHTILGYREFATPPAAHAICEFIRHVRGPVPASGFSRVSGGFPEANWLKVAGQTSPCTFSGKERP